MMQRKVSTGYKTVAATRSLSATDSVSFHDASLAAVHVFGDVVDEEGCCHIECRKLLWWTPEEEREIARAYEAVVYLMEKGQHTNEDDDVVDSSRGLEKRTEDGAWKLYETQRDFRNAVLCEQDRWRARGVTDVESVSVHLALACQDLSAAALDCARQMAQKDAQAIEAYLFSHDKIKSSSSRRLRSSSKRPDGANTSPLKSAASSRVVPWVRHVSMPLADTIETKALKATVEDKPIEKEAMTLAAKSVLDSRQRPNSSATTTAPTADADVIAIVPLKKKKKKISAKAAIAAAATDDNKVKKIKKIKNKTKPTVVTTNDDPEEDATNATKDTTDLEDNEIRSLGKEDTTKQKEVAEKKELARKESDKLRRLANKMSFGFDETTVIAKAEKKISSKGTTAASLSATLQDVESFAPLQQPSVKITKSSSTTKRKMKKYLGSSLSDLNNVSSDFSSAPHVLESSTSSFDCDDDEGIIKETTRAKDNSSSSGCDTVVTGQHRQHNGHKKKQLSCIFPRVFRQTLGGVSSSSSRRRRQQHPPPDQQLQEASCHF